MASDDGRHASPGDSGGSPRRGGLTHTDARGEVRMVDIDDKAVTSRSATATGVFATTEEVVRLITSDGMPKGDVLATARLAGIGAAKHTWELVPLCHQIPLSGVKVDFVPDVDRIYITASAKTTGKTGVEMEALTAVHVAALTLHDMVKAVDPEARAEDIKLVRKTGGRSGEWVREGAEDVGGAAVGGAAGATGATGTSAGAATGAAFGAAGAGARGAAGADGSSRADAALLAATSSLREFAKAERSKKARTAVVLTSSTRGALGEREDSTGPRIAEWLRGKDFDVAGPLVVADADIDVALSEALDLEPAVVLTTGGTGVAKDDRTPEAVAELLTRELPGIGEAMRAHGRANTPLADVSRSVAGFAGGTFIATLPGSRGGVKDGMAVLDKIMEHLLMVSAAVGDASGAHESGVPGSGAGESTGGSTADEGESFHVI